MKAHQIFLAASLILLIGSACFSQRNTKEVRSQHSRFEQAPESLRSLPNPYEGRPEAIQAGEKLFRRHCAGCHGEDAHGRGRAPSLTSGIVRGAAPGELVWFLKNGDLRAGMPSWSRLPDERLWQIVTYLQSRR